MAWDAWQAVHGRYVSGRVPGRIAQLVVLDDAGHGGAGFGGALVTALDAFSSQT